MNATDQQVVQQRIAQRILRFQEFISGQSAQRVCERLLQLLTQRGGLLRCCLIKVGAGELLLEACCDPSQGARQVNGFLFNHPELELPSHWLDSLERRPGLELLGSQHPQWPPSGVDSASRSVFVLRVGGDTGMWLYAESASDLTETGSAQSLSGLLQFSELVMNQMTLISAEEPRDDLDSHILEALWTNQAYLTAILRNSPALITVKNNQGHWLLVSDRCRLLKGFDVDTVAGKTVHEVFEQRDVADAMHQADAAVLSNNDTVELQAELLHGDGSYRTYWITKFPLLSRAGDIIGVCTIGNDISERIHAEAALKEQESQLTFMAFHDQLTGLPNRNLFYDRIGHSIVRSRRSGNNIALLLLDIDRFKLINDSFNHEAGDTVLTTVAQRLVENVRDMDTVARLGGDEFVVILEGVRDADDISHLAHKILTDIARPVTIHEHEVLTSVSMGIVMYPQDGDAVESLLKNAEVAMYKAKETGKNKFQFFTQDLNESALKALMLESELLRAIEENQLTLYYQPQFSLPDGDVSGLEVLVRWKHPTRGLISPQYFVSVAEESHLIVKLGDWVLRHACMQAREWINQGKFNRKIAVNLSPRQFREKRFTQRLKEILYETGLPVEHLELEITESCAMENPDLSIKMMQELNDMGVTLAIDDFGTGYSSLAYLKKFPIHKLKIDRSFVKDVTLDPNDAAIAQSIISLAHNMSLRVIAEGVEEVEQAEWLIHRHCDMVQGFYYARPMSAAQLSSHLQGGRFVSHANVLALNIEAAEGDVDAGSRSRQASPGE